jgi:hypothetical protein
MIYEVISIGLSITALIVSTIAIGMVLGLKWSTHKIEWRTIDAKDTMSEEQLNKVINDQEDNEEYDQL